MEGPSELPADADPFWEDVFNQCADTADANLIRLEELPEDAFVSFLVPSERGWSRGDREVICYLTSPGGLSGSFVTSGG